MNLSYQFVQSGPVIVPQSIDVWIPGEARNVAYVIQPAGLGSVWIWEWVWCASEQSSTDAIESLVDATCLISVKPLCCCLA